MFAAQNLICILYEGGKIRREKINIQELKNRFSGRETIDNKQIIDFFRESEPDLKMSTVNWRIYTLVQAGILVRIGRGKYSLENQQKFIIDIHPKLETLNSLMKTNFPFLRYCLWSSSVYREFMLHQPVKNILIIEVEYDAREAVFHLLKEAGYSVFLDPGKDFLDRYFSELKELFIIKTLVTEAPVQMVQGVPTSTLEKLLVDLFIDTEILDAQQDAEKDRIFRGVYDTYIINENKLLRYAARRRKREAIDHYLNKVSKYRQQS